MQLTLLGTGGTQPLPDRALASLAVTVQGHTLLLDCGEGTQVSLRKYGVSSYRIDAVLLTHYHGDHILGLPGLLQTLASLNRTAPLTIYGPPGQESIAAAIMALAGPLPYPVAWKIAEGTCKEAGLTVTPFPLKHRVPCCGYRLHLPRAGRFSPEQARALGVPVKQWKTLQHGESITLDGGRVIQPEAVLGPARQGLSFVFSGDTAPCPALEKAAAGADLLLCDSTYALPEQAAQAKQYGHSTFGQSAALAAKAGAKRLWLVHYSPMITDPEEELAQAQSLFPAAECGYDGKSITLQYEEAEE